MDNQSVESKKELLDREFSKELQEIWSAEAAQKPAVIEDKSLSFVVFKLCGEWFALNVESFKDVVSPRPIHTIPGRKTDFLDGVVNIEGELMLKVNPYNILRLNSNTETQNTGKFMLLDYENESFVIYADEFGGVEKVSSNQIIKAPAMNNLEFQQALSELSKNRTTNDLQNQLDTELDESMDDEQKSTVIMGIYKRIHVSVNSISVDETTTENKMNETTIGIIWPRKFFGTLKSNFVW